MADCIICKEQVDWTLVVEEFEDVLRQADMFGLESLTEHEQVVSEGKICGLSCYYTMQDDEAQFSFAGDEKYV